MATTYNGNAGGISLATGVTISVPADGVDPLAVSTVNTPLQKLADYVEALRAQYASRSTSIFGILNFGGTAPNSTVLSYMWNSGGQLTASATFNTTQLADQTIWMIPAACVLKQLSIYHSVTTAGGAINIVVYHSNPFGTPLVPPTVISTTAVPAGDIGSLRIGISVNAALSAGGQVYVRHEPQAGVTAGGGVWQVSAQITTA